MKYQCICYRDCQNSAKGIRSGSLKSADYKLINQGPAIARVLSIRELPNSMPQMVVANPKP